MTRIMEEVHNMLHLATSREPEKFVQLTSYGLSSIASRFAICMRVKWEKRK